MPTKAELYAQMADKVATQLPAFTSTRSMSS